MLHAVGPTRPRRGIEITPKGYRSSSRFGVDSNYPDPERNNTDVGFRRFLTGDPENTKLLKRVALLKQSFSQNINGVIMSLAAGGRLAVTPPTGWRCSASVL
ncbi:hypothetical protein NDU88_002549 [Pleurodeles waltl]|uniref:Uncharacterized protein n=1 Tax=Pleurodeles waltl TaxID=8319 RepID=A0AAV7LKI6_PLEWA|nr:hypothetical protein NDU88_002549 [Pleurodeles waltl]